MKLSKSGKAILLVLLGVVLLVIGFMIGTNKSSEYYVVKFYSDNGELLKESRVKNGEKQTAIEDPVKDGYIFDGWYVDDTKFDFSSDVNSDIKLVAKWTKIDEGENPGTDPTPKPDVPKPGEKTYIVTFNSNGGSAVEKQTVVEKGKVVKPKDPTKTGYSFGEWQLDGKTYNFNVEVTKDITLTALWKEKLPEFTVTFNSDGGSNVANQKVEQNKTITKPKDPTKAGYKFIEWQLDGKTYNFSTKVTKDITLKAKWEKAYTVTFNSDGGSKVDNQLVVENKVATKPKNPTRTGYKFIEWQLNGQAYNFSTPVTKDITLKAKWEKVNTVTFNSNGGSTVASQTVEMNKTVTKPKDPTRTGYKFIEWQLNGQAYVFSTPVTKDITLTAKWEKVNTVTFNSNGGSAVASQSVETNNTATKPSNPTRTGYNFIEWQLNGQAYNFSTPVTKDITLIAKWEIKKYTVTFNTNGGGTIASQTVEHGKKVTKPTDPVKEGYVFTGWKSNNQTYDFNKAVTSNLTLVAQYREKSYTFTVSTIDEYSPDRTIKVFEEGRQINFSLIKVDGVTLCTGSNPTVSKYDIEGVTSITVVLTGGSSVTARKA